MVQQVSKKISELDEVTSPSGDFYVPVTDGEDTYKTLLSSLYGGVFDIRAQGATPKPSGVVSTAEALAQATRNTLAIQAAIDLAEASGGVVLFPGNASTKYPINGQLTVTESNVTLLAPGQAQLFLYSAIPVVIAVGDYDTGANKAQSNTLASNSLAGSRTVVLAAGKGANVSVGDLLLIRSQAVIPEHDAAVVNKRCEYITVQSKSADTLTLEAPLRFDYLTTDTAEVYVIDWVDNFRVRGLGVDGNDHVASSIFLQMSWCRNADVQDVFADKIEQRFIRFQACVKHYAWNIRQRDGYSTGYFGTGFAYTTAEHGPCWAGRIGNVFPEMCRHGYTTGATCTTNAGVTSTFYDGGGGVGLGCPMDTIVGPGIHTNSRGAGWDTHEVGMNILFQGLETAGSMELGFQVRSVATRIVDWSAHDCVGAAMQIGSDAQKTYIGPGYFKNTNTGTTSIDWTKYSVFVDNGVGTQFTAVPNANLLDNSNFDLWNRGATFSATGGTANRWRLVVGTGETVAVTRRAHSAAGGVSGGLYYLRLTRTVAGSAPSSIQQYNEDVRNLAGQRVFVSYQGRDSVDGTNIRIFFRQYFGSGGTPSTDVDTSATTQFVDATFRRRNLVFDIPSIAGKTIGTNEDSATVLVIELPLAAGLVFLDLDWVKVEVSPLPTNYLQESLATTREKCARWFQCSYLDSVAVGTATSVGAVNITVPVSTASATHGRTQVYFSTKMARAPDTVAIYSSQSGTIAKTYNVTTAADLDGAVTIASSVSPNGFYGGATSTTPSVGDNIRFQWTAAVSLFE